MVRASYDPLRWRDKKLVLFRTMLEGGRAGGGGDVAHRGRQLVVLVVERARRRRQPEHAGEPAVPVERRRGDAAEVEVELLALDRVAVGAHALELLRELHGRRDRARRVPREAAADVARQRLRAEAREHDLAHRERVRVVGDLRAEPGHARDPLAATHDGDLDHAAADDAEVAALVGAQEQVVDRVLERVRRSAPARRRDVVPGLVEAALVHGEALVDEAREQVVGRRGALAHELGDLLGAHAVGVLLQEAEHLQHGVCGRQASPAALRPCLARYSTHRCVNLLLAACSRL